MSMGKLSGGGVFSAGHQPAQQRGGITESFCRFGPKRHFPPYRNAHSRWPLGRGQSQVWVGVAEGAHTWAHGPWRNNYPATACAGDVGWGRNKPHSPVLAQQEPTHSSSCCACGLLVSHLTFLPLAFVLLWFLLVYQSLSAPVPCQSCGSALGLRLRWLQGWGRCNGVPSANTTNSPTTSSGHLRNTFQSCQPLLPCGAGEQ